MSSLLVIIRHFMYIALNIIINAQEEIYSFSFHSNPNNSTGWSIASATNVILSSTSCTDNTCWKLCCGTSATLNLSTVGYNHLEILIDAQQIGFKDGGDQCNLVYQINGAQSVSTVLLADASSGPVINKTIYPDNTLNYKNNTNFQIKLQVTSVHTNRHCYVDNLRAFGISYTADPTTSPTYSPSKQTLQPTSPTAHPTHPSLTPTKHPSLTPTKHPTSIPTSAPSTPTFNPTSSTVSPTHLTSAPTSHPSNDPSLNPTQSPVPQPTISPTKSTASPTELTISPTKPTISPTNPTASPTEPTVSPTQSTVPPTQIPTYLYLVEVREETTSGTQTTNGIQATRGSVQNDSSSRVIIIASISSILTVVLCALLAFIGVRAIRKQTEKYITNAAFATTAMDQAVIPEEIASSTHDHDIEADEKMARELQMMENKHRSASNISINEDARLALKLQLKESGIEHKLSIHKKQESDHTDVAESDAQLARELVRRESRLRESIVEADAKYAQELQLLENKPLSASNIVINSADARFAIKLQLMESGVDFDKLVEKDKEHDRDRLDWLERENVELEIAEPANDGGHMAMEGDNYNQDIAIANGDIDEDEVALDKDENDKAVIDGRASTGIVLEDKEKNMVISDMLSDDFVIVGEDEAETDALCNQAEKDHDMDEDDVLKANKDKGIDIELRDGPVDDDGHENGTAYSEDDDNSDDEEPDEDTDIEENDNSAKDKDMGYVDGMNVDVQIPDDVDNELPDDMDEAFPDLPDDDDYDDDAFYNINEKEEVKDEVKQEVDKAYKAEIVEDDMTSAPIHDIEADARYARELQEIEEKHRHQKSGSGVMVNSVDARMALELQLMESGVDFDNFLKKQKKSMDDKHNEMNVGNDVQSEVIEDQVPKGKDEIGDQQFIKQDNGSDLEEDEIMAGLELDTIE